MDDALLRELLGRWRGDPGGTYQTWFLWEERLKNFRSIRRGVAEVVREIREGAFGSTYKGSSLESVVGAIAEQRQIFKGADHAFLWKPKLRIPDIYENPGHQQAFGRFLDACACCDHSRGLVEAIRQLDARRIKGLGPAAANLLYFLHPTLVPPFNTAIVKGYNTLTGANTRLGRWEDYLAMRDGILRLNEHYRDLLSNDLGALGGLLFDVGRGRHAAPPREGDPGALAAWKADLAKVREESATAEKTRRREVEEDRTHTDVQEWLRDIGLALGYRVWVAANDRGRATGGGRLRDGCLDELPAEVASGDVAEAVRLIDVLWIAVDSHAVVAAFEVEHTTSIYSGIVRLLDLALGASGSTAGALFIVAPDRREEDVRSQLRRPAFRRVADLKVRYIPYGELGRHRDSIARFGQGMKAIDAVARDLT